MNKKFLAKFVLTLSIFLSMIGLVGCSSEDTDPNSEHGTVEELQADPSCAEGCHNVEVLTDEE